jgi:hypothetical protein
VPAATKTPSVAYVFDYDAWMMPHQRSLTVKGQFTSDHTKAAAWAAVGQIGYDE